MMVAWQQGDLDIAGRKVHYYRAGVRGKPPVVLLHGFSNNGLTWTSLVRDLEHDYDLVAIDAAGHGLSGPRGADPAPDEARDSVIGAIDLLQLTRPALIGHSMGAGTATAVAAKLGDGIRCTVLEDPAWRDDDAPPPLPGAAGSPEWLDLMRTLPTLPPEEREALALKTNPHWSEEDRALWLESRMQFDRSLLDGMPRRFPNDWRELARQITCPVLLLTADLDRGAIVSPAGAREALGLLRAGHVVHIPNAGHNIRRDNYPPFRDAVLSFLQAQ
jgi:pimeloyl-ACP methyl ester carboxylesterase